MDINRLIGEDIQPEIRKFIETYFHKGNISKSVDNLIRKEKSFLSLEKIEKEEDLNFIIKVCKDYIKYKEVSDDFTFSSRKILKLMVMKNEKGDLKSDYGKKISNIKELVRQIKWQIDWEKSEELISVLESMNK